MLLGIGKHHGIMMISHVSDNVCVLLYMSFAPSLRSIIVKNVIFKGILSICEFTSGNRFLLGSIWLFNNYKANEVQKNIFEVI